MGVSMRHRPPSTPLGLPSAKWRPPNLSRRVEKVVGYPPLATWRMRGRASLRGRWSPPSGAPAVVSGRSTHPDPAPAHEQRRRVPQPPERFRIQKRRARAAALSRGVPRHPMANHSRTTDRGATGTWLTRSSPCLSSSPRRWTSDSYRSGGRAGSLAPGSGSTPRTEAAARSGHYWATRKDAHGRAFTRQTRPFAGEEREAAEGIRTLDLLHGKQ
jgi:hypothetical protein